MKTNKPPKCKRCKVEMKRGFAIESTIITSDEGTSYEGGPGKRVSCWKCPKCGRSIK